MMLFVTVHISLCSAYNGYGSSYTSTLISCTALVTTLSSSAVMQTTVVPALAILAVATVAVLV